METRLQSSPADSGCRLVVQLVEIWQDLATSLILRADLISRRLEQRGLQMETGADFPRTVRCGYQRVLAETPHGEHFCWAVSARFIDLATGEDFA